MMEYLKVSSPSLGGIQQFPTFPSVVAEKRMRLITPSGLTRDIALDRASLNTLRTSGSKLHYSDGSNEYLAALQEYNVFPLGNASTIFYLDNYSKLFYRSTAPSEGGSLSTFVIVSDVREESVWPAGSPTGAQFINNFDGSTVEGCNIAVVLEWRTYIRSTNESLATIQINGQTVASKSLVYVTDNNYHKLTYKGRHAGYCHITVSATLLDKYDINDFVVGVSALDRLS